MNDGEAVRLMKKNRFVIVCIALLCGLFGYCHWIETQWIEVTRHSIEGDFGLKKPLKLAHVSDLHIRSMGSREAKILTILEHEKPDAILVTGDSVAENSNYKAVGEFLRQLRAPLGVWLVKGNWEHWRPTEQEPSFYKSTGVHFLMNSAENLEGRIWLIGLDDELAGRPDGVKALRGVPDDAFKIALFHSPEFFETSSSGDFDLALTGHTHGGQIRLPFLPPLWLPEGSGPFVEGWYAKGKAKMYVSRGLGNSIFDLRLFCRPEIAIMQIGR